MTRTPSLLAHFITNRAGDPVSEDDEGVAHYSIRLSVVDVPPDAYAVTYTLHESYYDPVRESRAKNRDFVEEITSYGDYTVRAEVRTKTRTIPVSTKLSAALARGHGPNITATIRNALNDIRAN